MWLPVGSGKNPLDKEQDGDIKFFLVLIGNGTRSFRKSRRSLVTANFSLPGV